MSNFGSSYSQGIGPAIAGRAVGAGLQSATANASAGAGASTAATIAAGAGLMVGSALAERVAAIEARRDA